MDGRYADPERVHAAMKVVKVDGEEVPIKLDGTYVGREVYVPEVSLARFEGSFRREEIREAFEQYLNAELLTEILESM